MGKALKITAIAMLAVTVLAAAAVLYGMNTLAPQVVDASVACVPASSAQEAFDTAVSQAANGVFAGRVYGDALSIDPQSASFVTYTVRLRNRGFFPAEWIALNVEPVAIDAGQDVLAMESGGANVLASGAQGDLSATLLTTVANPQPPRTIEITCYVLGRKQTLHVQVQ